MAVAHRARVVLPIAAPPIVDGAVIVDGGRVIAVGPADEVLRAPDVSEVHEWDGTLTPGLVNAHTHLCFSAYGDFYSNGLAFPEWIQGFARRSPSMSEADWHDATRHGVTRSLAAGVTAIADVVTPAASFEVLLASELRGTAYYEVVGVDAAGWEREGPEWTRALEHAMSAVNGGMTVGISPHTLYTLSTSTQRTLLAMARERGLRLHPHLAESPAETAYVRDGGGPFADLITRMGWEFEIHARGGTGHSPTVENDVLGALGEDCHMAHGVHTDAEDRALLRKYGTSVALCPRSNARLDCGEAPVAAYRAEGNKIGVGTDSLASSPDLEVLGELPALRELALRQGSPEEGLDAWLVHAATAGGAAALGASDYGTIAVGNRADLAVFSVVDEAAPYSVLATSGAGSCSATMIGGRFAHGA